MGKLNSLTIQRATKHGRLSDGNGLYLQITPGGSKSWLFRYMHNKRSREMGLGPVDLVSLAEARIKALECRRMLLEGRDPIEQRNAVARRKALEIAKCLTFDEATDQYIESQRSSWRSQKHVDQWTNTLKTYATPIFGHLPMHVIDTALVMQVLEPIWKTKNETALRLRGRLERILAWAAVLGYRSAENPAAWRNHLDNLLPKQSRQRRIKHHAALPFVEIPSFIANLQQQPGVAPKALEFLVLTATRTSETLNAKWSEIFFDDQLWIIPANRMKGGIEHRVPLSTRAVEILRAMGGSDGEFVFPGKKKGRSLSNMALLQLLRRMNIAAVTHGFRSSFRDWAAERTNFPREVCEQALAHTLRDKVELAYRRSDLLLKRRALMGQWAVFSLQGKTSNATVSFIGQNHGEEYLGLVDS